MPFSHEDYKGVKAAVKRDMYQDEVDMHIDDRAVDNIAKAMKQKLANQRAKGYAGWNDDCSQERLSEMLRAHVEKGDPIDVANFCAFLLYRGEGIL